ncbi:MAG TPA: nitroreductase family protein [Candidatus Binataceae bacterium]|jgi:nitroreductase|nr:nitroreductase family protein [Candidatus Binataceae bacterium]
MAEIGLFEAMYSARALRRFKPDPVPDEVMTKILDAAIRAPSGSNAQSWLFVVVKDAGKRRQLGAIYSKASKILTALYAERPRVSHFTEEQYQRFMSSVTYLFDHMHEAPVLLLACLKSAPPGAGAGTLSLEVQSAMAKAARTQGASIYPAVQNIILACRAFNLTTVLTTIHAFFEEEVKAIVKLPPEVSTFALMPIGFPRDKIGPVRRRPVNEVACLDTYGKPWPG